MKYGVIVPWGLVVNTDVTRAVSAFKDLAASLKLGVDIDAMLPELQIKFLRFALGGYNREQDFADALITAIKEKIPSDNTEIDPNWEQAWQDNWRDCWNAACVINGETCNLLRLAACTGDIEIVFISETNPTHYKFIAEELNKKEVPISRIGLLASFKTKQTAGLMMARYVETYPGLQHIRLRGNPESIKHPHFRKEAVDKEARIALSLPASVETITIDDAQLTMTKMMSILQSLRLREALATKPATTATSTARPAPEA